MTTATGVGASGLAGAVGLSYGHVIGPFEASRIRLIQRKGRIVSLQRGELSVNVIAFLSTGSALSSLWTAEVIANTDLRQGDVQVQLLADLGIFPAPPRDPDLVVAGTVAYTVLFANPVYESGTLIGWVMAVRGA